MARFAQDPLAVAELFDRAKQAGNGLRTSRDFCSVPAGGGVDWRAWLAIVLPRVDLFVPSFDEMAEVLGLAGAISEAAVRAVVAKLHQLGAAAVVLKLGEFGLFCSDDKQEKYVPCLRVSVATTTGAGDSTIAGLIAGLSRGSSLETSLALAIATGRIL